MDINHSRRRSRGSLRALALNRAGRLTRGFTLIELLVVTAIIVIITGVILADNNRFGGVVQLQNLAYDVALSIREAQVYGISVAGLGASGNPFGSGYGMHFDVSTPQQYELFTDTAGSGIYAPSESIPPSPYAIESGYKIEALCVTPSGGAENCSAGKLDVVFKRPEPDAWISASVNGSETSCINNNAACESCARIVLMSPRGDLISVVVGSNGQISVGTAAQCDL